MSDHPIASDAGYSPPLKIELDLNGRRFGVVEMSSTFLRLRDAVVSPPGIGTVHVELDGHPTLYRADFFDGIDPQRKRQPCQLSEELGMTSREGSVAMAG